MPPPTYSLTAAAMNERLDAAQVEELAHSYGRKVFLSAYRVLGDAAQAEDVQQDLFLQLLEKPLPDIGSWSAWLATAATRMAIDRLRRRHRWQRLLPAILLTDPRTQATPDQVLGRDEQARWLRRELGLLPRLQAQCFALRHLDGREIGEIAAALSISANHVSVNLHRAAQRLQRRREYLTPTTENSP